MGFRDHRSFILAMISKQVLRIIQFPNSLLSRIFKAKYFPNCGVLVAPVKSNASFSWKSIASAIDLIRHGLRWRIGIGTSIDVWHDNWLPRDYALRPFTPDLYNLGPLSVASLIDQTSSTWDINILNTYSGRMM